MYALHEINSSPHLETILCYIPSVNITRENHFFAFDETLETFGIKFIKQSLSSHRIDLETLKLQIKSAQSEAERLSILINEFLEIKKSTAIYDRVTSSKKEIIWKLAMELLDLFETPTNTKHRFLETTPQMTQEGYVKLAACYENGKKRMENLYKQEVTGEEQINTSGRRTTEVKVYTYEEIQKIFKENQKQFKENQKMIKTSQHQLLKSTKCIYFYNSRNTKTNMYQSHRGRN